MSAEACTTWSNRKRHYSTAMDTKPKQGPGRYGTTLCGEWAMDQDAADGRHYNKPKRVADLPDCKICAKRAEKLP